MGPRVAAAPRRFTDSPLPGQIKSWSARMPQRTIWDVTVEALDLIRELIAKHRIDCDWTRPPADGHQTKTRCGYPFRARRAYVSLSIPKRALHAA